MKIEFENGSKIEVIETKDGIRGKRSKSLEPPYSQEDYDDAKSKGLDLDDWNDYVKYYGLGEDEEYE